MKAKKLVAFSMLCLYALGTIGGIGYALWGGSWPCAAGCAALAWMAWPQVVKYYKILTED